MAQPAVSLFAVSNPANSPTHATERAHTWAVIEALAGAAMFLVAAAVGAVLAHHHGNNRIDVWGYQFFPADLRSPLAKDVVELGSAVALVVGVVLVFAAAIFRDRVRALACAVAPIVAVTVVDPVLKHLVHRYIAIGELTYPSGTVTVTAALAASVYLVSPKVLRPVSAVVAGGAVMAVSGAVLVLRWHFATDVLGGICVGAGTVFLFDGVAHLIWPPRGRPGTPRQRDTSRHRARKDPTLRGTEVPETTGRGAVDILRVNQPHDA
jgi:membrane-associated phospholipid phosphatase